MTTVTTDGSPRAVALWEPTPQSRDSRLAALEAQSAAQAGGAADVSLRHPLTGLIGPTLLADRLRQALAGSRRNDHPVMVALLDLDRFGRAYDELDDKVGDHILTVVASRLTEALRATDTVAHLGRDQFAIIVERPGDAELICRRFIEKIAEPMDIGGVSIWMSVSVGASIGNGDDPDEFLRFATIALQRSKERGGDSCTVLGRG